MSFLHPLGLLALVAVPVLIVLSLWRWRRREVQVSSLLLWRDVAAQWRQAPHARRRRQADPLVVLRVAAALALAAALCGLAWVRASRSERTLVLVLDRSASMAGPGVSGAIRWQWARGELERVLARLGPADRVEIVAVPPPVDRPIRPRLTAAEAVALLRELGPSDAPVDSQELIEVATGAARRQPDAAVIVATDAWLEGLPKGVAVVAGAAAARNRGIVTFAARPTARGTYEVLVGVANAGDKTYEEEVSLRADGRSVGAQRVSLKPRGRGQAIFDLPLDATTVLEARLDKPDDIAADNRAWLARRPGGVRVAWVGDESHYLRRALSVQPGVEVVELPEPPQEAVPSGFDFALYYHAVPRKVEAGNVVAVAPRGAVGSLRPDDLAEAGQAAVVAARDPLMAAVRLDGIAVGRVRKIAAPQDFETLASADGQPLIGRWRQGEARAIYVGIDPATSDWPLDPSFPIFWANVVATLGGPGRDFGSVRPGQLCQVDWARGEARLDGPGGSRELIGGVFRPERVGVYTVKSQGREEKFAVSLLSEAETLAPGGVVTLPPQFLEGMAAQGETKAIWPLTPWLALAGLLLVLLHGWLASRSRAIRLARNPQISRIKEGAANSA